MSIRLKKRFRLGKVAASFRALDALLDAAQDTDFFFPRHSRGDWGYGDTAANELALATGGTVISEYKTLKGVRLLVVTDLGLKRTVCVLSDEPCILLPDQY